MLRPARLYGYIFPVPPTSYTTSFPSIENPLSNGGIFINGATNGTDWHDMQVTANGAVGSQDNFVSRYADDLAHLSSSYRTFGRSQYAQGTYWKSGSYAGGGGSHEMELLLLFDITSGNARGYELSIGMGPSGVYAFIVRWNGTLSDYTALIDPGGGTGSYSNTPTLPVIGDVFKATVDASGVLSLYQNGTLIVTATDTTYTTGQPGLGAWPVDGATATSAGWSSWSADDL